MDGCLQQQIDIQIRNGNLLLDLPLNGTPTASLSRNWEWAVAVNIIIFYPNEVGGVRWNVLSPFTKVRDTIEEVNVNGFLMNNITFMPTIPQCV